MARPDSTRWTVIRSAADGDGAAREEFARRYEPVIRAYLGARWRLSPLRREIDDAAQEVFLACFGEQSPLGRAEFRRPGGFRAWLHGIVRNVARGFERKSRGRREQQAPSGFDAPAEEDGLSRVFDRAWASGVLAEAASLQARRALTADARRRVEILELRFGEDLPIREIAAMLDLPAERAHREYARARREFRRALLDLVRSSEGGSDEAVESECLKLLAPFS